ncbi:hypothetical protein QQ045_001940 [Rhodiola kirilowii]
MRPSKDEEQSLREFNDESPFKLGPAEKFLKQFLSLGSCGSEYDRCEAYWFLSLGSWVHLRKVVVLFEQIIIFETFLAFIEDLREEVLNEIICSNGCGCPYRSAKELKTVGIHFRPSRTQSFTDVSFQSNLLSGTLWLPPLTVDDSTKSMLLNMVAYETCPDAPDDFAVTSYICLMDALIDQAEDVMELRSKGILLNLLGSDQQVADLFNEIGNDLASNPNAYSVVKEEIENHYRNKLNIWIAQWLHPACSF